MREIRFRAWNMQDNEMHVVDELGFGIHQYSKVARTFNKKGSHVSFYGKNAILMQFTGLKDKNGVDIYEGDILEREGATIVIKCEDICIQFFAECINENHPNWCEDWIRDFYRIENFIIIGNVYENPELLGEK